MKHVIGLGLLYCASAIAAPLAADVSQATANGPGGIGIVNGGTVNVHVDVPLEEIERAMDAKKGEEREKQLRALTRRVNALEKAQRSQNEETLSEEQVEKMLSTLRAKQVPRSEWATRLADLAQQYLDLQSRFRALTASDEQTRRLLEKAREAKDPREADELLEQAAKFARDRAQAANHEATELTRQAANVTVCRATLALTRMDRVRAAQLLQKAFQDRAGDVDPEAVGWLVEAGTILDELGEGARALALYSEARLQANTNLTREPGSVPWQHSLAFSDEELGLELLTQGRTGEARSRFQESVGIRERLSAADRSDVRALGALIWSHELLAQAWLATQHAPEALQELETTLTIATSLAAVQSGDPFRQRAVLQIAGEIAFIQRAERLDTSVAIESLRKQLASAQKAAEADPANLEWRWNQAVAWQKIADSDGEDGTIVQDHQQALGIYAELAAKNPTDVRWKIREVEEYESIGSALARQKQPDGAVAQLRLAFQVAQELAGSDPSSASFQSDLAAIQAGIGDLLNSQGHSNEALDEYRTAGAVLEHLTSLDSTAAAWQEERWRNDAIMGKILAARKSFAEALQSQQQGLKVAQAFAELFPSDAEWQVRLLESLESVGQSSSDDNNPTEALKMFRAAAQLARKFARTKSDTYWACHVAWDTAKAAQVLQTQRHYIRASWGYRKAIDLQSQLAEADPTVVHWRESLRQMWGLLGDVYLHRNRLADAGESFREATLIAKGLIDAGLVDDAMILDMAQSNLILVELNRGTPDDWSMLHRAAEAADRLEQSGQLTGQQKEIAARFRNTLVAGGQTPQLRSPSLSRSSASLLQ
jgi:tetratricopeptide (TPR) repeat protein